MVERSEEGITGCASGSCYGAELESSAVIVNAPQVTAWQQPNCNRSEGLHVNCFPWREQCAGAVQQVFPFSHLSSCVLS